MRNPFKTIPFSITFFTSFLFISAVLIALLGSTGYYITNQEVVDKTISSRRLLLNEINKQIELQLNTVENDSLVISSNPVVIQYLQKSESSFERIEQNAEVIDLLSRHSYVDEAVHSVQLYAKNTTVSTHIGANGVFAYDILKNSPSYETIRNADSAWFGARPLEVEGYLAGKEGVVSFMRKVLSTKGEEIGILSFNLKLSYIRQLMSGQTADGARYVLDSNMRLMVESDPEAEYAIPHSELAGRLPGIIDRASEGASYAVAELGKKRLLIWSKQQRTGWIAMDIIPWDQITQGSRRIQQTIGLAAAICVILAVTMAFFLSRQFVRPIRRLIQAMNRMKQGHLDLRVENDYENEFGYLNKNFNQMTQNMARLLEEVNEQNRRKREAEMRVLQEQINPHFLYNTLDTMNWHAIESGADEISRMLSLLGRMLRIGLSSGAAFITVAKELEHLQCYAELQKIRYRNHIRFEFDLPDSLNDYYIPKLTLQPFVENALIHGFHSGRRGMIRVAGWLEDNKLIFSVEDDGHGMDPAALSVSREHTGFRNVRERIELYFGFEYGIKVDSRPGAGTKVIVCLPKLDQEPSEAAGILAEGEVGA
ncbi:histidine kinase [Paenibacillus sp. GCM10027626]|uniref:histidine kinase n=1 Tax=Paenibacillus sp. GCM10027626 TaxID=3273411 RepID=UPI00363889AC